MRRILLGTALALLTFSPASAKTIRECVSDYEANKAAIQGVQTKAAFVAACRAGNEAIPGAAASPLVASPAPAPASPAAPATSGGFGFGRKKPTLVAPAPSSARAAPSGANQFSAEAQARGRCPGATVVWVNTGSAIYHFAGTKNYGNTKEGAYMCEPDAKAAGDRASKTEHHP